MTVNRLNQTYFKVADIHLYCEYIFNDKPPILLIHGLASSTYTFKPVIPFLQNEYSILAVDLPGFGKSEKPASFVYSFENYAKLLIECLQHFHISNTSIAAHSMGGQIALHMARLQPEKINQLILLCSSGYLRRAKKIMIATSYVPFFEKVVKFFILKKGVKGHLYNALYNKSLINEEMIREFGQPLLEKEFYQSLIRLLRHREGDLKPQELSEINIPTLLMWGEEDRVVPVDVGRRLVQDLPDAQLITFEDTGHLITAERPDLVSENIIKYCNGA